MKDLLSKQGVQGSEQVDKMQLMKIEQELDYSRGFLVSVQKKLSNERFVNSAPKNVVDMERKKESDALTKIALLEEKLNTLV